MRWTVPNILTVLRLVAVPLLPLAFLYFNRPWADWFALILFILAAVTDYVDGYLARAWGQESRFGAAMDPIADKALVLVTLLVIAAYSGLAAWIILPAGFIIFREVFVSGLRETLGEKARNLKVTRLAKWKTAAQMLALTLLFVKGVLEHHAAGAWVVDPTGNLGVFLLWVAAILTVITGWDYFWKAFPFLNEREEDD